MSNLLELRLAAHHIFEAALRAVNPKTAVKDAVRTDGSNITIRDSLIALPDETGVFAIAIGKAATAMALGLDDVLGDWLIDGVLAAPRKASSRWQYFEGGHPLPNEDSLAAAEAAFALLDRANEQRAFVLFLVSGGGSAMLEYPISDDITLEDLRSANQTLVSCGASIGEINAVRRAFSAVKGGRLSARALNCRQVTLIVSDVPVGEEHNVASGPTLLPPADAPRAVEVVARYHLRDKLPASIMLAIENSEHILALPLREGGSEGLRRAETIPSLSSPLPAVELKSNSHSGAVREQFVLLTNSDAMGAAVQAAQARGFITTGAFNISDQPIEDGCKQMIDRLRSLAMESEQNPACLISGGEFACPVRGDGIGGRNSETALRLAIAVDQNRDRLGEFVALCVGTDGIDGNSPAAGAIVDSTTIERARQIGLDASHFLNRSDAFSFFDAVGDAIVTGPTGTNVRDLRILLAANSRTSA